MLPIRPPLSGYGPHLSLCTLYLLTGAILVLVLNKALYCYRRSRALPPGPRGLPLLGNVLQIPARMAWFKFAEWTQEFGPIFSIDLAGKPVIVLNTFKVGADLLDRRSNIYSNRPRVVMLGEILTGGMSPSLVPYGTRWRKIRRVMHEGFGVRAIQKYQSVQAREAALATMRILKKPNDFSEHLGRSLAGNILNAVYGWPPISEEEKPVIDRLHAHVAKQTESTAPGAYLVDRFPVLKHVPLWMAKWKREGLEWHQQETQLFTTLIKEAEENLASGKVSDCFVDELVENAERHGLTEKEAAWVAGTMLAAGEETTFRTSLFFILAIVLYPGVMHKAHAELDKVVGRERIPTFDDQKNLPYIEALVKEVLRWRPVAPLSLARIATEDNWYESYLIPKGAIIIPNTWAMNRDPDVFPDFDEFRPERFLDWVPENTHSMGHTTYGFGRRICPGSDFANQMLFISFATILWASSIGKAKDANGQPITPSKHDYIDNVAAISPAPFKCEISPRFPDALSILERERPEETR